MSDQTNTTEKERRKAEARGRLLRALPHFRYAAASALEETHAFPWPRRLVTLLRLSWRRLRGEERIRFAGRIVRAPGFYPWCERRRQLWHLWTGRDSR